MAIGGVVLFVILALWDLTVLLSTTLFKWLFYLYLFCFCWLLLGAIGANGWEISTQTLKWYYIIGFAFATVYAIRTFCGAIESHVREEHAPLFNRYYKKKRMISDVLSLPRLFLSGICKNRKPVQAHIEHCHQFNAESKNISQITTDVMDVDGQWSVETFDTLFRKILYHAELGNTEIYKAYNKQVDVTINRRTCLVDCSTVHGKVINKRLLEMYHGIKL